MSMYAYDDEGKFVIHSVEDASQCPSASDGDGSEHRTEVLWFADAVRKAFRGCEVRPDSYRHGDPMFHVFMPEDLFTMGWINVTFNHDKEALEYIVYSRDITNNKYTNYSVEFRCKVTTRKDVAIRNAKKYLRRFSPVEVINGTVRKCERAITDKYGDYVMALDNKWRSLFHTDWNDSREASCKAMLSEMYMLMDSGHEFMDKELPEKLTQLRYAKAAKEQAYEDKKLPMYSVRVYERLGKQAFDVCAIPDIGDTHSHSFKDNFESFTYYEDLPEDILGKLSTLSICDVDTYVPRVGYRYSEGMFYVTQ